mmetsp:Transcript_17058/g.53266  ORF Transcript_17058/g.53266 Transcript_17058/m.53266 type:complete len:282 (+) Transcript_17058:100-945(+)
METKATLSLMALAQFLVAGLGVVLPSQWVLSPVFSSMANVFIGGLIISTAFVHLLGEAVESDTDFPWSCVLCGAGYLGMLSLETFANQGLTKASRNGYDDIDTEELRPHVLSIDDESSCLEPDATTHVAIVPHSHVDGAFAATVALSVHSVGDGVAIAVQSSQRRLMAVGLAVLAHKFFASYALGTMLAQPRPQPRGSGRFYGLLFVLATPLTIVASLFLGFDAQGSGMQRASAACAGSLLYVGLHEILFPHMDSPIIPQNTKLVALWLGFAVMSLLALWV